MTVCVQRYSRRWTRLWACRRSPLHDSPGAAPKRGEVCTTMDGPVVDRDAVARSVDVDGRRRSSGHSQPRTRTPTGAAAVLPRRTSAQRRSRPAPRGRRGVRRFEGRRNDDDADDGDAGSRRVDGPRRRRARGGQGERLGGTDSTTDRRHRERTSAQEYVKARIHFTAGWTTGWTTGWSRRFDYLFDKTRHIVFGPHSRLAVTQ